MRVDLETINRISCRDETVKTNKKGSGALMAPGALRHDA